MASAVKNALGKFLEGGTWDAVRRAVVMTRFPANARLVGTDSAGNRYYEQSPEDARHPNQNRFVEYADGWNGDASQVPSSWHAWLHHMTDDCPANAPTSFSPSQWMKPHKENLTGSASCYRPPGHVARASHAENFVSGVEEWTPGSSTSADVSEPPK